MKTCTAFPMMLAVALAVASTFVSTSAAAAMADPRPTLTYAAMLDRAEGQAFSLNGRVDSVDYASNVIVVRSKGDLLTIRITPTTSVERDGQIGSIADLRPGVRVRVKGSIRDGEMTAESIIVR